MPYNTNEIIHFGPIVEPLRPNDWRDVLADPRPLRTTPQASKARPRPYRPLPLPMPNQNLLIPQFR